ncbi:MAG: hypothetical protein JWM40_2645, partial [Frankiales bacterium]|nr:hypothetical protein [Frankiales bacterium]
MSQHPRSRLLLSLVVGSLVATACGSTVQTTSQLQVSGGQGTGLDGTVPGQVLPQGATAGPQVVGGLPIAGPGGSGGAATAPAAGPVKAGT